MLKEEFKEMKEKMPIALNDGTTLISCDFNEDTKTLEYGYVVPKELFVSFKELAETYNTLPEILFKQSQIEAIKQDHKGVASNIKLGFIYRYNYYDEKEKLLFTTVIDIKDL